MTGICHTLSHSSPFCFGWRFALFLCLCCLGFQQSAPHIIGNITSVLLSPFCPFVTVMFSLCQSGFIRRGETRQFVFFAKVIWELHAFIGSDFHWILLNVYVSSFLTWTSQWEFMIVCVSVSVCVCVCVCLCVCLCVFFLSERKEMRKRIHSRLCTS